jgi:hypothetical protein
MLGFPFLPWWLANCKAALSNSFLAMAPIRATTWHEVCFLDDDDLLVGHGRRARVLSMLERVIYLLVHLGCGEQKELEENAHKWEEDQKGKNLDFYRGLVVTNPAKGRRGLASFVVSRSVSY